MFLKRVFFAILAFSFIASCDSDYSYECSEDYSDISLDSSFLIGQREEINVSSISKRPLGLACHNCYENGSVDIGDTMTIIHNAINVGVNLIELDVLLKNSSWIVSHEEKSDGPLLRDILSDKALINSDKLLFIEVKGSNFTDPQLSELLSIFGSFINDYGDVAYVRPDRLLVIRNSGSNKVLVQVRTLLNDSDFSHMQHSVKLSRLYHKFQVAQDLNGVYQSKRCGLHMIEFDVLSQEEFVLPLAKKAREEGLLVNFFTVTEKSIEESVGLFEYADVLTLDKGIMNSELSLTKAKLKVY